MYIQDIDLTLKDWAFSQRKGLPYNLKLKLSERRIRDWYNYYGGQVYVSFSGGLDSTVLLHMVRSIYPEVEAVFCDTGLEYPELKEFIKSFDNVTIIKPDISFRQVIKKYGYPLVSKETAAKVRKLRHGNLCERYRNYLLNGDERGKLGMLAKKWRILLDAPFDTSEKCCDVMKKKPFRDYQKQSEKYPFIGITQDEGFQRQRQYEKTGCNVFDADKPKSQPMGFWTKQDVLRYAYENKLEICSVYGEIQCKDGVYSNTGVERTGCMFCAFGCHLESCPNRFQRMEHTHPQLWDYCMKDWDKGGLGMAKVLDYINVPYLAEVDPIVLNGNECQQYKIL
ncbi:phosphoadenosine phosphosulfate reductase family protein [Clostridium cadaveris]|uniref:phosphoadenosine phosphosulfate reductase family protein n=1 Tax=Clostridium cadaveris TaxID=1529 RepID=UPI000C07E0A5|nr:phosphoadenosine phosphosulfate reductase family protein [Clostridium cadaveris]MDM8313611.1 phosphoadenosine phosphosulfate reductase family protein [Clostridium cadaveris]